MAGVGHAVRGRGGLLESGWYLRGKSPSAIDLNLPLRADFYNDLEDCYLQESLL